MLSTQQIYNFLVNAESPAGDIAPNPGGDMPQDPSIPPVAPLNAGPTDEDRIEGLRVRLEALVGISAKKANRDDLSETVFGERHGQEDPDAEDLDPEWEEILRQIAGESDSDSKAPTVSLRPRNSISP